MRGEPNMFCALPVVRYHVRQCACVWWPLIAERRRRRQPANMRLALCALTVWSLRTVAIAGLYIDCALTRRLRTMGVAIAYGCVQETHPTFMAHLD